VRRVLAILWLSGAATVADAQPGQPPAAPPPAPADSPAPPPVEAPKTPAELAFLEGRELLDAGQFAAACAKFETSLEQDPTAPGTLLNLGLCNERLGKTATALQWFRKAQFRAAETGMTDYEDVAKINTFSLAVRVPTLRITFANPRPAGSVVFVDNQQVADVDLLRLEVDPNVAHVVELRSDGKPPIRTEVLVKDGDTATVVIPVPARAPPQTVTTFVEVDRGKTRRVIAYSMAGGGVGLWAASLIVSLDAKRSREASERPEDWVHYKNVARWTGTSLFAAGTAAIGVAALLYFTAPGVERVERTTIVGPVVGGDQLGVAVHGAF
jgi:hypothetical protein